MWVTKTESTFRIGITEYATDELGEIVFIELPEVGTKIRAGEPLCAIDSLKSASDLYAPISGSVVATNEALENSNSLHAINKDPAGSGWVCVLQADDASEYHTLMTKDEYLSFIGENHANSD